MRTQVKPLLLTLLIGVFALFVAYAPTTATTATADEAPAIINLVETASHPADVLPVEAAASETCTPITSWAEVQACVQDPFCEVKEGECCCRPF